MDPVRPPRPLRLPCQAAVRPPGARRPRRGVALAAQPVHDGQHVLRLRVRHLRDARRVRDGRAVHRHRGRARHARRPHRADDRHGQRVRRAVRLDGRHHLVRHGAGGADVRVGPAARSAASAGRPAFLFVTAAALRLARFNIQAASADKRYFVGMPSPAAAGILAATVFAYPEGLVTIRGRRCRRSLLVVSRRC